MNESTTEQKPEASPEKLLLAQLHQKLTEAGLSFEASTYYGGRGAGFKVQGVEVGVQRKYHGRFGATTRLVVMVGALYYRNRHIYHERIGGRGYNWTAIIKEIRRQIESDNAYRHHAERVRVRHDESKRLMDAIVEAHGLLAPSDSMGDVSIHPSEHHYRGPKLDIDTGVVVNDGVESRQYKVTLELDPLTPEQLDAALRTLSPLLVEHKLAKEQGQ